MGRKPRYLQAGDTTAGKWVVSYSDIVTILLVLFVGLAAQAFQKNLIPAPVAKAAAAKQDVVRPSPEPAVPKLGATLIDTEKALQERGITPTVENRGLVVSLPQSILFPSGEDHISSRALPIIAQIAGVVRAIPNRISLVGHSDAVPIHSVRFKNNWELATARSVKLLELLTTQYGIPESRLSIASPGAYRPKAPNDTEEGRAENRRVDIVILPD
ncbi:MAG: flagellar motor protein MotB [Bryobacteraceae bacterium]